MKKKNDLVVIIIVVATILVFAYLVYFNVKKNTKVEINASVKETGAGYVIVVDEENNEYQLTTDREYNEGDRISAVIKNVKDTSPITCEVIKIDTISKTVNFSITDIPENTENNETENITTENNNTTTEPNNSTITAKDNDIITHFSNYYNEIENTTTAETSIKEKFVTLVDFIFYDGEINNKTFKELSTSAKLKVLQFFLKIDNKIETKFPNYKDSISSTGNKVYTNVKTKALEKYFELTSEVCSNNEDLCNTAKEGLKDLKNSFSLTWDFIKTITDKGIGELSSWYQIWKEI